MTSYIIRRVLLMFPTMLGIMTHCFFNSEFVPGGPIDQVRAQLEGKGQGGPARGAGPASAKHRRLNAKDEMRLLRQYNYHITRGERYLRTILWYSPDSIITSKEVDDGESTYFQAHGRKHVVVRADGDPAGSYRAFEAGPRDTDGKISREVAYDPEKGLLRDTADPAVTYDAKTGKRLSGAAGPDLLPARVRLRPASRTETLRLAYDADGKTRDLRADSLLKEARQQPDAGVAERPGGGVTVTVRLPNAEHPNQTVTLDWSPETQTLTRRDDYTEVFLDESVWRSLANWENWHGYFLLKFGRSVHSPDRTANEVIFSKLPVSIRLGVVSFFITYLTSLLLGIAKAVRNGSRFDFWTSTTVLFGYSIPGFTLAVVLLALCGETDTAWVGLFPQGDLHSLGQAYERLGFWGRLWDDVHHMAAPVICYTIGSFATLTMFTKNNVLNETHQLYAVAARARGLSERKVLFKHILRNALVPLITVFPASFLFMFFGGSLLIERIFNLDGLGLLGYTALMNRDYPLVMGDLFMFGLLGLVARLVTDVCYVIADPRISFEASQS